MVEVLQKAMDFGLSWVATIALAYYVWHLHKEQTKMVKENADELEKERKQHREEVKEITKEYTDKVEAITENYTTEVSKLREAVENNTSAFKVLYDVLVSKVDNKPTSL